MPQRKPPPTSHVDSYNRNYLFGCCAPICLSRSYCLPLTYTQAYGSSRIAAGNVQQIIHWPGSFETFRKVPTCLLYDQHGQVLAWGLEAKNASLMPGTVRCEWYITHAFWYFIGINDDDFHRFKLFLEPHALRDGTVDPRLPQLPVCANHLAIYYILLIYFRVQPGKKAIELIVDFLSCLWEYAKEQITREIGVVADLSAFFID